MIDQAEANDQAYKPKRFFNGKRNLELAHADEFVCHSVTENKPGKGELATVIATGMVIVDTADGRRWVGTVDVELTEQK